MKQLDTRNIQHVDVISLIEDDIKDYERLCRLYGEEPKRKENGSLDVYGEHATALRQRATTLNVKNSEESV